MAMSGEAEIVTVDKIAINILTVLIYCVFGQTQCRRNDTKRVRTQRLLANNTAVAYEQHDGCMRTTQRLNANDTGAEQPAYRRSLFIAFVVRSL